LPKFTPREKVISGLNSAKKATIVNQNAETSKMTDQTNTQVLTKEGVKKELHYQGMMTEVIENPMIQEKTTEETMKREIKEEMTGKMKEETLIEGSIVRTMKEKKDIPMKEKMLQAKCSLNMKRKKVIL
jgi:hypothetical protein